MRLKSIRLSGFKSFVDPTTIALPSNLVAVVGPNGCGKSNIIDAVRWVIGESGARQLRGEAMTDVIFNGSTQRAASSYAAVELLFDNTSGRFGGEYARYPEISIKRQVTRDTQSVYWLNGARCRRKDVLDLFLGTGLSPRGYAIIEQGAINRIIEARPQDLKDLLEEAAGVSRYKEQRHETEIRMGHTRDNLTRLDDVIQEVAGQLNSLKRQAAKAEKYVAWKAEERQCRNLFLALRWQRLEQACRAQEAEHRALAEQIASAERALEQHQRDTATARSAWQHRQQALHDAQGQLYAWSGETARLEQAVRQAEAQRGAKRAEHARLTRELADAEALCEQDREQLAEVGRAQARAILELEQARRELTAQEAAQAAAETQQQQAQQAWREVAEQATGAAQEAKAAVHAAQAAGEQVRQSTARRQRLTAECDKLTAELAADTSAALAAALAEAEAERARWRDELQGLTERIDARRHSERSQREYLHDLRSTTHRVDGQLAALERLQRHATGKDNTQREAWLARLSVAPVCRLAERLEVEPGWETAVERVLGAHLQALCFDIVDAALRQQLAAGTYSVAYSAPVVSTAPPIDTLAAKVSSPWALPPGLAAIRCAANATEAMAQLAELAPHQAVVTPDGALHGPGWGWIDAGDDGRLGVLQRERELRDLRVTRETLAADIAQTQAAVQAVEAELAGLDSAYRSAQQAERAAGARVADCAAACSAAQARIEQYQQRLQWLDRERAEASAQQEAAEAAASRAREQEAASAARAETLRSQQLTSAQTAEQARQTWQSQLRHTRAAAEAVSALAMRGEALQLQRQNLERQLARTDHQAVQHRARLTAVVQALAALPEQPPEAAQLTAKRAERDVAERQLAELRSRCDGATARIDAMAQQEFQMQRAVDGLKQRREQVLPALQGDLARLESVCEQLAQREMDPVAVLADGLVDDATDERGWQQRADEWLRQVEQLGPVNLAAVADYQAQAERKTYLDAQRQDLLQALEVLDKAIHKIDRESRALFRDTFGKINAGFVQHFGKLFGGGTAVLELTDHDVLEAGVSISARPPGKRNSSIHLLSGGEKALTAAALVFAIFDLNPAPFCLLDEVDAPLDEANVGRFGQLVKEMSDRVQFLVITHNKATMEIAQYLTGVTMKEPGVSRIVAVDVDQAVELAAQ